MLEFQWSLLLLGLSTGICGFVLMLVTSWWSPSARRRGGVIHWLLGWLVNGFAMSSIGASWLTLSLLKPRWDSPVLFVLGIPLCLLGALIFFASARMVGRLKAPSRYDLQLHTKGLYAWVRHPQALGLILIVASLAFLTGSVPLLGSLPLWIGCWFAYTWFEEELELIPVFGDRYRTYVETTPRLWPRIIGEGGLFDRDGSPIKTAIERSR